MNKVYSIILLSSVLLLTSCYEEREGCLDPLATNFNAEADEDCCCTYPKLSMVWDYYNGQDNYSVGDTIDPNLGRSFALLDFDIIGACVALDTNGGWMTVREKTQVQYTESSGKKDALLTDDAFYLSPTRFNHDIGSFIYDGPVNGIQFLWSPIDSMQSLNPLSYGDASHPLRVASEENLWNDSTGLYQFCRFRYAIESDTQTISLGMNESLPIQLSLDTILPLITPLEVRLRLDFKELFSGIDLNNQSSEDIWSAFRQNVGSAVIIVE